MRPVTIAIVEDDDGHAHLIEKNLRRAGVVVECYGHALGRGASDISALIDEHHGLRANLRNENE